MNKSYYNFLKSYDAHLINHSHGSLLDHLYGTYSLLNSWKLPKSTCIAGLFHSIYGNEYFKYGLLDINNRKILIDLIGKTAEELVYYFNTCDRTQTIINAKINLHCINLYSINVVKSISKKQFTNLIFIIFANELDQIKDYSSLTSKEKLDLYDLYKTSEPYLNKYAIASYKELSSSNKTLDSLPAIANSL